MFSVAEYQFLNSHALGRLASVGPGGEPQIHPVTFAVDAETGLVEIGGPALRETQKFRNIARDPRVSLVVDEKDQGIEIRGDASPSQRNQPLRVGFSSDVIRIRPALIVTWNLDRPGTDSRYVV